MLEDSDGKRFMFEVYSENSKGTVVQGKHKTYRFVLLLKKNLMQFITENLFTF